MSFDITPGARNALMAHPLGQQLIARPESRVTGPATGVPTLQTMLAGNIDVQYGVRLPQALVQQFTATSPILTRVMQISSTTSPERAAVYGLFTGADFTAGDYGDFVIGSDPPGITVSRTFASVVKKSYGAMAALTDVDAIASGQSGMPSSYGGQPVNNDRELLLRFVLTKTLTALDYSVIKGNESSRPTQFNGIETALTYDATARPFVIDRAGATTGTLDALNNLLISQMSYGITPTELWMHPVTKQALLNDYLATSGLSINIQQGDSTMTLGQQFTSITTVAGELPIFTSTKFTLAGSSPNLSGDIFVITNNKDGVPLIGMEWQVPPTAIEPLARVPGYYTSSVFGVWAHGVLVERSGWWAQGRIRNVGASFNTTTYKLQTVKP